MAKNPPVSIEPTVAQLVDELGELSIKITELKPAEARAEAIKARLKEMHADLAAEESKTLAGERYESTISACGNRTAVDLEKAYRAIGADTFWPLFKQPPTTEILKQMPLEAQKGAVSYGANGPRTVTTRALPPKQPAAAKKPRKAA